MTAPTKLTILDERGRILAESKLESARKAVAFCCTRPGPDGEPNSELSRAEKAVADIERAITDYEAQRAAELEERRLSRKEALIAAAVPQYAAAAGELVNSYTAIETAAVALAAALEALPAIAQRVDRLAVVVSDGDFVGETASLDGLRQVGEFLGNRFRNVPLPRWLASWQPGLPAAMPAYRPVAVWTRELEVDRLALQAERERRQAEREAERAAGPHFVIGGAAITPADPRPRSYAGVPSR